MLIKYKECTSTTYTKCQKWHADMCCSRIYAKIQGNQTCHYTSAGRRHRATSVVVPVRKSNTACTEKPADMRNMYRCVDELGTQKSKLQRVSQSQCPCCGGFSASVRTPAPSSPPQTLRGYCQAAVTRPVRARRPPKFLTGCATIAA